ncbi:hypothetical protein QTQ03_29175 [Micromonospora sp. WMMA1363]|uniref:hypothetical protein n=1 Tax=Micromonospora sp. WMMA1363 TaxID=3053985 RepID=UPI00259CA594|nr:hypothetical protein [Micromonospora sp. WMMA1363]MDM4723458.1 hypothetical protein [Micromonospora sp. WMMA1363]
MIAYRAMVDVPRELVQYLGRLLAAQRRAKGTRRDTRALTCFYQALLVLVWFRKGEDATQGPGVVRECPLDHGMLWRLRAAVGVV